MKQCLLFFVMFLSLPNLVTSQKSCLAEGINFGSDGDVARFVAQYPDCTHIIGNISAFVPLNSLEGLEQITSIGGNLGICCNGWSFDNLKGLDNLESIGGYLHLSGLDGLKDISALSKLTYIGGELKIFNNLVLENLNGLENLTYIGGFVDIQWNDNIQDLSGLQNVSYVGGNIEIDGNEKLENIDGFLDLQQFANSITITDNPLLKNLNGFSALDSVGAYFTIRNNPELTDLSGLQNLRAVGKNLSLESNPGLADLADLQNLERIDGTLKIKSMDKLKEIGEFSKLKSLDELEIGYNDSLISINGLNNLESINKRMFIRDNPSLTSINGLNALREIGEYFWVRTNPSLRSLDAFESLEIVHDGFHISENDTLETINGLENLRFILGNINLIDNRNLVSIKGIENVNAAFVQRKTNYFTDLTIRGNTLLSECEIQPVCLLLEKFGKRFIIEENGPECDEVADFECSINSVSGIVYFDKNQDGMRNPNEFGVADQKIQFAGTNYDIITDEDGRYSILLTEGNDYEISLEANPHWNLTSVLATYMLNFNPEDPMNKLLDFGIYPTEIGYSGTISLSSEPTRCNRDVTFNIRVRNMSHAIINSRIDLALDPLVSMVSVSEPLLADFTTDNHLAIDGDYLDPQEYQDIIIVLKMPSEQETGSPMHFKGELLRILGDEHEVLDEQSYDEIVLCSYDPNDKLVSPIGEKEKNYTLQDEEFTYTIRFQNTGNAEAIDIRILDTISPHLDISTFAVTDATFPPAVSIDGHAVSFFFENIFLPDSTTNEELSQGYVSYKISPLEGADQLALVENTAHIIFDFNPPIITNTTMNTLVDSIGQNVYTMQDTFACKGDTLFGFTSDAVLIDTTDMGPLCLLIETLNIHFFDGDSYFTEQTLCQGDSVIINGEIIVGGKEDIMLVDTVYSFLGCIDSVNYTTVQVIQEQEIFEDVLICEGESYQGFSTPGNYQYEIIDPESGCDNIVFLSLEVVPHNTTVIDTAICEGSSFLNLSVAGTYQLDSLDMETGCLSTFLVNLSILDISDPACVTSTKYIDKDIVDIFPNPAQEVIHLSTNFALHKIRILNSNGRTVFEKKSTGFETTIDISSLVTGIYFVEVISVDGIVTSKVVVE